MTDVCVEEENKIITIIKRKKQLLHIQSMSRENKKREDKRQQRCNKDKSLQCSGASEDVVDDGCCSVLSSITATESFHVEESSFS